MDDNKKSSLKGSTIAIIIAVVILLIIIAVVAVFFLNSSKDTNVSDSVVNEVETPEEEENNTTADTNQNVSNTTDTDTSNSAPATLSTDWKNTEFALDGTNYKMYFDYSNLQNAGWTFDLADYGYSDGYILNQNDKVTGTIDLENPNYDADVSVGFTNISSTPKDIMQCQIWSIEVDNTYAKKPVTFNLPGGIHNGSSLEEVVAAYGEPEEDNKYRSDELGYWTYTYQDGYSKYFKLTIYDDKGVTAFEYDVYKN